MAGRVNEYTGGVSYLTYLRALTKRVHEDWKGVMGHLRVRNTQRINEK